jgi:hypothetical protein
MTRGRPKEVGETRSELVRFRVKPSDLERWKAAAEATDLPLSTWLEDLALRESEGAVSTLPVEARTSLISLKVSKVSIDAYDRAAAETNLNRHSWMKTILDMAADVSELPIQLARIIKVVESKHIRDGKW